jgi:hypothetical protein
MMDNSVLVGVVSACGVLSRCSAVWSDGVCHSWAYLHAGSRPNLATFVDCDKQLLDTASPLPLLSPQPKESLVREELAISFLDKTIVVLYVYH